MNSIKKNKLNILIFICTLILLSLCFNRSLWADEAWSAILMKSDFKGMMSTIASDVHPPLYFIILKSITLVFGNSIVVMKIVSILPVIILMLIGKHYVQKFFNNERITILFIILVALTPCCMHMAVEVRMYSWSILFVTWSGFLGYEIYHQNTLKNNLLFVVSGLLAAYSHNFNIIAEVFVYGILFLALLLKDKKNLKNIILISLLTIIGYVPWLLVSFEQLSKVNENFWLWPINLVDVAQMLIYPFNSLCHNNIPNLLILLIIGAPLLITSLLFIIMLIKGWKTKFTNKKLLLGLLCYLPMYGVIAIGVGYSILIKPVFVARYMHSTLGIFFLGVALLYSCIEKNNIKQLINIVLVINLLYGYAFNFQREYLNGTEDTLAFMEKYKSENDNRLIVTDIFLLSTTTLNYYESDCIVYSNENYDFYSNHDKVLYFADTRDKIFDSSKLDELKIKYQKIYTGNIDNEYFFDVYEIN